MTTALTSDKPYILSTCLKGVLREISYRCLSWVVRKKFDLQESEVVDRIKLACLRSTERAAA